MQGGARQAIPGQAGINGRGKGDGVLAPGRQGLGRAGTLHPRDTGAQRGDQSGTVERGLGRGSGHGRGEGR